MVDHQLRRQQRVDAFGIAAERGDRVAHRREVDDRGHAGEVLQQHARRSEGDLAVGRARGLPVRECFQIAGIDGLAVLVPEQVLEHDLERVRQAAGVEPAGGQPFEAEDLVPSVSDGERRSRLERVSRTHDDPSSPSAAARATDRSADCIPAAPHRPASHGPRCVLR
jgi:hypothetical protein